ncbi:MAG: tetratricopeptide repeat protein [Gaiellaceae bacterium]
MARAAVKAKQQQAKQARGKAQPGKARTRGRRRHAGGGNPNQQLFFMKMRRHAKWVYVLLALLFAITFAALGVGSGTNSGLDQVFSGLNIFGGSGGTSISKAQKEVDKNPQSAKAYRDLATAYEAKSQTAGAIGALTSYTGLKKKDAAAWSELAGLQLQQAQQFAQAYSDAAQQEQLASPSTPFMPTGTLGTAVGTNKVEQAAAQEQNAGVSNLYTQASTDYQSAVTSYEQVTKLKPKDANAQFQLANAAESEGDYTTAVAALQTYLQLNPNTPQRAQIESLIKQMSPAASKPSKKPKAKKSSGSGK